MSGAAGDTPRDTPPAPVSELRTRRRIEFADTDLAGLVHFARFFVFMETAEHELLRSLGHEVHRRWQGHRIGWPRVAATCDYLSPARFPEVLDIRVRVARKGTTSMTYRFDFEHEGRRVAVGTLTAVCCRLDGADPPRAIPIPADIADRLAESDLEDAQ
ncbi:MAG: acyl-CoA thioesterase [Acidobacteriota bacterium]|nr:acyl-CoA thioesterase [Acidobacteriota bacterium]MDH3523138.1 acyl-CoA thioesterase [Acidobacteriota bacterium]